MNLRAFIYLLRRSFVSAFYDNCFGIAKGAAYSALLSFFPLLASAAAILVQTHAEIVSAVLVRGLYIVLPPGSESLALQQFRSTGARPFSLLLAAGAISVWAASGVVKSLIEGFQAAYRVPRNRGFLRQNGVAAALVLLSAVPLIAATLLILFGGVVERAVLERMRVDPLLNPFAWVWRLLSLLARYVVSAGAIALLSATLYRFGPYRKQRWRQVWPGAVLSTALWLVATSGFAWYVRNVAHYNVMYGSLGAGVALLVWMYLTAAITLVGCEFNAEYERMQRHAKLGRSAQSRD